MLHLTGITPALGPGPLRAVERAIEIATASGTLVSFDVNYRSTLWSADEAGPVLARLAGSADVLFRRIRRRPHCCSVSTVPSGPQTFDDGEHLARGLAKLGPATVVVKLGALGSLALSGDDVHQAPTRPVTVVDAVGAGDAFVAGYLSEHVAGGGIARLPGHGQPPRRRRLRGARRLGGTAHPGRTERAGQTGDVIR